MFILFFSILSYSFIHCKIITTAILPFSLPNRWWMLVHPIRPLPPRHVKLPKIPCPTLPPILNNHVPRRRNNLLPMSECRGRYIRHNLLPNFVLLRVCGMEENSIRGCQFEHGVDGCYEERRCCIGCVWYCYIVVWVCYALDDGACGCV